MLTRPLAGALATALLLASTAGVAPVAGQAAHESPAVLRAADLAPAELLTGPRFQVEERVPTDGLLARFTIKSDFGPFEAEGPGMLAVRVSETAPWTSCRTSRSRRCSRRRWRRRPSARADR